MYLRFIDSLQFMNESQNSLVKNTNNFYHLESEITNNNNLLKKKGIYPYDYRDSWNRFNETQLPHKSVFFSKLNNEHPSRHNACQILRFILVTHLKRLRSYVSAE